MTGGVLQLLCSSELPGPEMEDRLLGNEQRRQSRDLNRMLQLQDELDADGALQSAAKAPADLQDPSCQRVLPPTQHTIYGRMHQQLPTCPLPGTNPDSDHLSDPMDEDCLPQPGPHALHHALRIEQTQLPPSHSPNRIKTAMTCSDQAQAGQQPVV